MDCHEFEARWQQLLDDRRSPQSDTELAAHALVCDHCRDLLAFEPWLVATRSDTTVLPTLDLADRVLAKWSAAPSAPASAAPHASGFLRRVLSPTSPWYSTAAALLLVCGVSLLVYRTTAALRPKIDSPAPQLMLSTIEPERDVRPHAAEPQQIMNELLVAEHLVPYQDLLDSLGTQLNAIPRQSMNDITGSLRPVTDSVGSALNALRRSLPLGERSPPAGKPQASRLVAPVTA